jgi:hypothetical protein
MKQIARNVTMDEWGFLYVAGLNFVFGLAERPGTAAVISLYRLGIDADAGNYRLRHALQQLAGGHRPQGTRLLSQLPATPARRPRPAVSVVP